MKSRLIAIAVLCCMALIGIAVADATATDALGVLSAGSMAVGMTLSNSYNVGDKLLQVTRALPNGAANVTSTSIDLGHGANGGNLADHEFLIEAPAVNTTQLPNAQTLIYDVVTSDNADLSSPTTAVTAALTQTGAGGVGAAAASQRVRLPTDCKRYVGLKCTKSGAGDASGSEATFSLKF